MHTISLAPEVDDNSPRMVTIYRGQKEVAAVGAADATDAAVQAAILILQQPDGLTVGTIIQVTRI
jgi:hypothetical protein